MPLQVFLILSVYSMFGFSEYVVVISNILFHMTTVYDLRKQYLFFTRSGFTIEWWHMIISNVFLVQEEFKACDINHRLSSIT